jgi:hypothetical protein
MQELARQAFLPLQPEQESGLENTQLRIQQKTSKRLSNHVYRRKED